MKYNSILFNKFLSTINNTANKTQTKTNDITNEDKSIKVSPPTTASSHNMAAVTNSIPLPNTMVTSTRFTDEYDLKEELGK
jgi:hypothetical protein